VKQDRTVVVGTRGSALALAQAAWVLKALQRAAPATRFEYRIIRTTGDKLTEASLRRIAGKGVFTKEIERALLDGRIDLAVHSLKDLPTTLPSGLRLGAVPRREDPRDVFIGRDARPLARLPAGSVIGTSSPRRRAQLLARHPRLRVEDIRGNLGTRLAKLAAPDSLFAGIVVARAGLRRLRLRPRHVQVLPASSMIPAPGQGAIAVEIREGDHRIAALAARIHDARSAAEVTAERALLALLGGGCALPIAARGEALPGGRLCLIAVVASPDGRRIVCARATGRLGDPGRLAASVHARLWARGGASVLRAALRAPAGK
jgi:hydroxymethylbilane synthase